MSFSNGLERDPVALVARLRVRYRLDYILLTPPLREILGRDALAPSEAWTELYRGPHVILYRVP
jgi:hypothetical protein